MQLKVRIALVTAVVCGLLAASGPAHAQQITSIAGTVIDATGAVLPGATAEAASPALIEGVRSATTDSRGEYKILGLEPGTYEVTFTLPGFATIVREGIVLTTGFTANVNAEMPVGGLEETITVTGASPVVDVQSSTAQRVMDQEFMQSIPIFGASNQAYAAMTLGAVINPAHQDVGGIMGEAGGSADLAVHGANRGDSKAMLDGMLYSMQYLTGGLLVRTTGVNPLAIEETVVNVSGNSSEHETGGAIVNAIPRDGSNAFTGLSVARWSNGPMQSDDNRNSEAIARGVTAIGKIDRIYDFGRRWVARC